MTEQQLRREYNYRVEERLGIMCGDREPTPEERKIAHREAQDAVDKLRKEDPQ